MRTAAVQLTEIGRAAHANTAGGGSRILERQRGAERWVERLCAGRFSLPREGNRRWVRPVKATRCAGALRAALTGRRAGWGTATERWGRVTAGQGGMAEGFAWQARSLLSGRTIWMERTGAWIFSAARMAVTASKSTVASRKMVADGLQLAISQRARSNGSQTQWRARKQASLGLPQSLTGHRSRKVAMDRNRMLLFGSAAVLVLLIAYMMFGPGGPSIPR